jgi:hypothetical protein
MCAMIHTAIITGTRGGALRAVATALLSAKGDHVSERPAVT